MPGGNTGGRGLAPGGLPYKNDGDASSYLLGVNKGFVLLRVFSLQRSTAEAFAVLFRALNQNNLTAGNMMP